MNKRKKKRGSRPWTPLAPIPLESYLDSEATPETREYLSTVLEGAQVFGNDSYVCVLRLAPTDLGSFKHLFELCVRRTNRQPVHDWRDLQRIKNEVFGELAEAVELYPAEARLVDAANVAILYVLPPVFDEKNQPVKNVHGFTLFHAWPFGFQERLVGEQPYGRGKQRPFPADRKPPDLQDGAVILARAVARLREAQAAALAPRDRHPVVTNLQQVLDLPGVLHKALADNLPRLRQERGEVFVRKTLERIVELVNYRREVAARSPFTSEDAEESDRLGAEVERVLAFFDPPTPEAAGELALSAAGANSPEGGSNGEQ